MAHLNNPQLLELAIAAVRALDGTEEKRAAVERFEAAVRAAHPDGHVHMDGHSNSDMIASEYWYEANQRVHRK